MSKPQINEEKYAQLVNEKMKEHSEYKEGMRVELTPTSTDKPLGLHMVGKHNVRGIVNWAEGKVREEYDVVVNR